MAHTSLYRKYRPQSFDDVVGQEHITRTLRNAVAEGRVAHAYLFSGPRGTGKTTTARILAKALLCERGPTPDPDTTCSECTDIAEGRHPDVFELDAASRTGVDNVREEIIGRVQLAPSRGGYKIYIIDEVHMLSTAAFNALLKTLEEPPPHIVFIMATTHPHKVPETIQSRCQRFDFHRMSVDDIAARLRYVAEAEGYRVDRGAFSLMARHAAGGMRDALTTLEQLASFTGGEVTMDDVEGLIGEVDAALLFEVADLIARRDVVGCFRFVARFVEGGADIAEFTRELTGHMRDLFVTAAAGDPTGIVDRSAEETARLSTQASEFGTDRLARILDLLGELQAELRISSDPRLSLEVALTRMARPESDLTLESLAERIEALESGRSLAPRPAPSKPAPAAASSASEGGPAAAAEHAGDAAPDAAPVPDECGAVPAPEPGGALDRARIKRAWPAVLAELKKRKPARARAFAACEVDMDPDGATVVIEFPASAAFTMEALADDNETRALLGESLGLVLGQTPPFRYQLGRGAVRPAEPADEPVAAAPVAAAPVGPGPEGGAAGSDAAEAPVATHGDTEAADAAPGDVPDIEHLLVHQLGGRIVAEHRNDDVDDRADADGDDAGGDED